MNYKHSLLCAVLLITGSVFKLTAQTEDQDDYPVRVMDGDSGRVVKIKSQDQFDKLLYRNKRVVAVFVDENCPVCKKFKKQGVLAGAAVDFPKIRFAEISIQKAPDLHEKYDIAAYPTIKFFEKTKHLSGADFANRVNLPTFEKRVASAFNLKGS